MKIEKQEYEQCPYDDQILRVIFDSSKSLSPQEIAILTGIKIDRVCKKLVKLNKYGLIKCSNSKNVRFWRAK